jgi:hypothetical protein
MPKISNTGVLVPAVVDKSSQCMYVSAIQGNKTLVIIHASDETIQYYAIRLMQSDSKFA